MSQECTGGANEQVIALYAVLEGYGTDLRDWYLRDKRAKRMASRFLRGVAILLATAGSLAPVVSPIVQTIDLRWGYVALGLAAGCVAFDRLFGISTAWMRDISGAQRTEMVLSRFYCEWASIPAESENSDHVRLKLELLRKLSDDLGDVLTSERVEWQEEFRGALRELRDTASRQSVSHSIE